MPILNDFDTREEHAAKLGVSPRTLDRWRSEPDGLPYTLGGKVPLFKDEWTRIWLEQRRRQRNPRRSRNGRGGK